ncbi:uncharacterized protein LOC119111624 [Pollicipes pollicipes]|uniref:uncharacterized protein LOC119111624 n=1 Tax=Pollicipes pollicipes TaxID=41117 RepID=UPI001884CF72|nr:uncharacterized protein LOC119111624 [Pollicipes pollicipes]
MSPLHVEKVDDGEGAGADEIALDGDGSLDDTLGYVAEFESFGTADPLPVLPPGPSQRLMDDGSSQGCVPAETCAVCGARYHHRRNLAEHMKRHLGRTTCLICRQEFAMTFTLRRHMVNRHGLAAEEVGRLTNKRRSGYGIKKMWLHPLDNFQCAY